MKCSLGISDFLEEISNLSHFVVFLYFFALIAEEVLGCSTCMQSQNDRMVSVRFPGKPFNITVIQVYAPTSNTEEAEVEQFYEDLQDLL